MDILEGWHTALLNAKVPHLVNDEDCWYSCALAKDDKGNSQCCNQEAVEAGKCTCGASVQNDRVDYAILAINMRMIMIRSTLDWSANCVEAALDYHAQGDAQKGLEINQKHFRNCLAEARQLLNELQR